MLEIASKSSIIFAKKKRRGVLNANAQLGCVAKIPISCFMRRKSFQIAKERVTLQLIENHL